MKIIFALLTLVSVQTLAQPRNTLCTRPYAQDIFVADLELSLVADAKGTLLSMDTPTAYGIRPYYYEINSFTCSEGGLAIKATSISGQQVINFQYTENSADKGSLKYEDKFNSGGLTIVMSCSRAAIQAACSR